MRWLILLLFPFATFAQNTYPATSCSQSAVQAAVNAEIAAAVDGDLITIPAGSCTYTGTTPVSGNFTKNVTIQGAGAISATTGGAGTIGTDQTILLNHMGNGLGPWTFQTIAGKSIRVTGVAFTEDSGSLGSTLSEFLNIGGQSTSVRVDHCHVFIFLNGSKGIGFSGAVTGVADHIYINTSQQVTNDFAFENGGTWNGDTGGFGNGSWADTDHFGSAQFMYVEDSRFEGGYVSDCTRGGRYVVRHSTVVNNNGLEEHGTHDQYRGCRAVEDYLNTFNNSAGTSGGTVHANSSTYLVWGNSISGYGNAIDMNYYRIVGFNGTVPPAPPNGFGGCGQGTMNGPSVWDQNSLSNGYSCLDMPTRGQGDLLTNYVTTFADILNSTTGTRTWPHQALIAGYVWNNSPFNGPSNHSIVGNTATLTDNLDWFQQFGPGTFGEPGTFNGTAGIGTGSLLPSVAQPTCTTGAGIIATGTTWLGVAVSGHWGPGYWNTTNNTLYVCTATNTWTAYYTPFTYPHPLTGVAWNPGSNGKDYTNGGPNGRSYSNGINGANGRKYP